MVRTPIKWSFADTLTAHAGEGITMKPTKTLLHRGDHDAIIDYARFIIVVGGHVETIKTLKTGELSILGRVPQKPTTWREIADAFDAEVDSICRISNSIANLKAHLAQSSRT